MDDSRWGRWAPLTGIAFVVLYVVGMLLLKTPDSNDPLDKVAAYYGADKGNRVQTIVAMYLLIAAAVLFLVFLNSLRDKLRAPDSDAGPLTSIMFSAGILFVGLFVVGVLAIAAVPGGISLGGMPAPGGDVVNTFQSLGWGLILIGAMLSAAVMIFLTSIVTLRTHVLPAWSAWLGFVAAIVLLFAVIWIPQLALLIWALAVSGAMVGRRAAAPRAALST